jgi:hypothetical protein
VRAGVTVAVHWVRVHWLTSGALGVVVAVAAVLLPLLVARHQRRQQSIHQAQADQTARAALLAAQCLTVVERTGVLPRVGQVRPVELGVHPAAELRSLPAGESGVDLPEEVPVYVPRDKDAEVDAALARGGLVVLVGDSTAGKSRAAYEAVRRLADDRRLLVPHNRESLRRLLNGGMKVRDVVVWLDDLERYLGGTDGLDVGLLRRLVGDGSRRVVVLATMRASEYAARSGEHRGRASQVERELQQTERALLEQATRVELGRRFSPGELGRAEQRQHDPRIADALAHAGEYGLAEYVAAGPRLWRRWRDGFAVDNPPNALAGAAITAVAVDCRRAGLTEAVSEALLEDLFLSYLEPAVARRLGAEVFAVGLAWAAEPVQATSALLLSVEGGWIAFDYLVDRLEAEPDKLTVPDATWAGVVAMADGSQAHTVAFAALLSGQYEVAEQALRKAVAAGDHVAENNLGLLFFAREDLDEDKRWLEAEGWLRRAAEAGDHPAEANLGVIYKETGRLEEGERWLRRAAEAGEHPAESNLGMLLQKRGELEEAEQWLRRAAEAGEHPAENGLGVLLQERGELEEAERWYRKAVEAGRHDAEFNLGMLLQERGELEEAEQWLRRAAEAGEHPAEFNLGILLQERGELEEAEQWLRRAAEAGHHDAEGRLGELLKERGELEEAEQWYRRAAEAGHHDAENSLRLLLAEQERVKEAEQ